MSHVEVEFGLDLGHASTERKEKKAAKDLLKMNKFVTWISARHLLVM